MALIQPRVLKGFRDFLPEDQIQRERTLNTVTKIFHSFGLQPIDTPILEYTDILLGKGGGETDKQIYRFTDNGDRDVSMRFDLTVPFARYMALHSKDLPIPFKRYHIGKVFRGENTQRGRYREFMQCDFDIVGTDSVPADFEILLIIISSLKALGIPNFTVHLSNRGIFNSMLENMQKQDLSTEIMRSVDKLAKIGEAGVKKELNEYLSPDEIEKVLSFVSAKESADATLKNMEKVLGNKTEDILRMEAILNLAKSLDLGHLCRIDPAITRGLDYYTGVVFETFINDLPGIGSVASGGRYDNLASLYTKEKLPGVGASIGIDRLLAALDELQVVNNEASSCNTLIFCMDEKYFPEYFQIADSLRKSGISCEVYPQKKKLGQQFSFAEKKDIPIGILCGEDEFINKTIKFKDLKNRQNYSGLTLDEAQKKITELLNRKKVWGDR
ncbi:MAG: histidine--tRNA ligase [Spirochaetia bacterium]